MPEPSPPPSEVLAHFGVTVTSYLGGRQAANWLVARNADRAVLRRYPPQSADAVRYEAQVIDELGALGWPAPTLLAEPLTTEGSSWGLSRWLPGERPEEPDEPSRRARGALLARFHADSEPLAPLLGQRDGWHMADEVVADPALHRSLAEYDRLFPEEARLMRWHAERAHELFESVDLTAARRVILHSDFVPWNLLYEGSELTGVLDFESTHSNFAVADFALAWRGWNDDVILGYNNVRPLDDVEWAILTPTYWSWLFLGVTGAIRAMVDGSAEPARMEWILKKLSLRSPLMGEDAKPYPG